MDHDTDAELRASTAQWALQYKPTLHEEITKILATTALAFNEGNAPKTIDQVSSLHERARFAYQNDPVFHARINQQVALIMNAIDECDRQQ